MNTVQCKAILGQGISGKFVISGFVGEVLRLGAINATGYVTNVTRRYISAWFNLYLSFVKLQTGPLAAYYKLSLNRVLVVLSSSGFKFFLYADKASELRSELDFVKRYRDGNIILSDDNMQKKDDLLKYLKGQGFKDNTEYLASLKLVSLTIESEKALQTDLERVKEEFTKVVKKPAATVWLEDLEGLSSCVVFESLDQQGKEVKPGRCSPVIPMVLVNVCEGIGVGWYTIVPNYPPIHIIKNIIHLIDSKGNVDKLPVEMRPWYKGFHGRIEGSQSSDGDYTSYGCIQESNGMLKITELPIRKWTDKYLKFLNSVAEHNADSKDPFIKGYKKYGDDTSPIDIRVKLSGKQLREAKQEGLKKKFKLEKKLKTSNMVLFQKDDCLKLYRTPQQSMI
ncbi:hypothetical protein ACFX15_005250 [Malus domestica]